MTKPFDMDRIESDALPEDVVSFRTKMLKIPMGIHFDPRMKGTRAVYGDGGVLLGFFVSFEDYSIKLFLAKDSRPFGLYLDSGVDFYFTIQVDTDSKHKDGRICGRITEVPLNDSSVKVPT